MPNRTKTPDWDRLPDHILQTDAARLFGVQPGTLNTYVRRGKLRAPVAHGTNAAWYEKAALREYWEAREVSAVQYYGGPEEDEDSPAAIGTESGATPSPTDPTAPDSLALIGALGDRMQAALAAGIAEATAPLAAQVEALAGELVALRQASDALREELVRARNEAEAAKADPPTLPPTNWWGRLTAALRR